MPVLAGVLFAMAASSAAAASLNDWRPSAQRLDPQKAAVLALDGDTGQVLYDWHADAERHPASLTKLMTLYILFEALRDRRLSLSSRLTFSQHAAGQAPTNLHVKRGDSIRVDQAIQAIIVHSANDAAVAIAEALGGTEAHFAQMMTAKARAFGMKKTFYHNASGLPDPLQITTARDLGILARHVAYDFPQYYHFFASRSLTYHNARYRSFDRLVGKYQGADGMKTGYTAASGFNLVSSAVRRRHRVVAVILGGRTEKGRDYEMRRLLDTAFAAARKPTLVAAADTPRRPKASTLRGTRPGKQRAETTLASAAPSANAWIIQIGAFGDRATARARLDDYAKKAGSLLDDANRIVVPFEADSGRKLYRARFGSFARQEARQLCADLMQRGQTCFTARSVQD